MGSYAGVEGDGGLVDAEAAELEQLLELDWQGRRHGEDDALGCAGLMKSSSQLCKSCCVVDGRQEAWNRWNRDVERGWKFGGAGPGRQAKRAAEPDSSDPQPKPLNQTEKAIRKGGKSGVGLARAFVETR
jgi:hypothetical protein